MVVVDFVQLLHQFLVLVPTVLAVAVDCHGLFNRRLSAFICG